MQPLSKIKELQAEHRKLLQTQYGINSAEALFENATRNSQGVQAALNITSAQLDKLMKSVEVHLTPEFIKECRKPVVKRARGVIVDQ